MNFDIISQLTKILEEDTKSWEGAKKNADEFVINSRIRGTHQKDLQDAVNEEDEENEEGLFTKVKKNLGKIDGEDDNEEEDVDDNDAPAMPDSEQVETPDESPSTINLADSLDFTKLIKLLNQFRASRSLTDEEVYSELYKYFKKLTDPEKSTLYVLLKGLVQITLLDVNGNAAYSPSDLKFSISKKGSASSEKIKSIKRKQNSKEEAEAMSNAPIKIGDAVQEKKEILEVLRKINA
jgi:hypothetical protein